MPRHRRSFTRSYRVKAAHLVIDEHRRVAEVARELDLNKNLLHTWVRDERWRMAEAREANSRRTDSNGGPPLSAPERAELVRLRATVAQQAKQIAFLEEASAYFAAAASKPSRLELIAAECTRRDVTRMAKLLGGVAGCCLVRSEPSESTQRKPFSHPSAVSLPLRARVLCAARGQGDVLHADGRTALTQIISLEVSCRLPLGTGGFAVEFHGQLGIVGVEDMFTERFSAGLEQCAERAGFRFDVALASLTGPLA